ncbi:hypothetical protein JRF84_25120 [Methylobacterium organophilum]|uniref:hypothetical protein n=1 Tax=Methylobacterium organophilum TaxID=410 RepID=UPI0019D2D3F0|nr:hypothetical protein [Methylobacterium organophilum]MBN6822849.1 hypothetical protein [Methylobacterium organophilum]
MAGRMPSENVVHTETFTMGRFKNVIRVIKLDDQRSKIVVLTDKREIGCSLFTGVEACLFSNTGREGMLWNLHTARRGCERRGFTRKAT